MRTFTRNLLVAVVALAAAFGLFAPSASAAVRSTYTVTPGGMFSAGSGAVPLEWPRATFVCDSSQIAGTLRSGSGLDGTGIGDIERLSFAPCDAGGVVWTLVPGFGRDAKLPGSTTTSYENSTRTLHLTGGGTLTAEPGTDCLGLVQPGDHSGLFPDYRFDTNQTITSP